MLRPHRLGPFASLFPLVMAGGLLAACGDDEASAHPPAAQAGSAGTAGHGGKGGTAGAAGKGASGGGQAGAPVTPTPPTPPAAPVLTPCPAGWSEKTQESGQVTCEPGPLPSWTCPDGWEAVPLLEGTPRAYSACRPAPPEGCAAGEMSVVGQKDCQPIGDPCPDGDFPINLPTGQPVVYVKSGAAGGDGSLTKPFGTIGEALTAAPDGGIVAVGAGVYKEHGSVTKAVTLWGRCATAVEVRGAAKGLAALTVAQGGSLDLRNATVSGQGVGLLVQSGGNAKATGVWLHEATGVGIEASGGTVALSGVLVSETLARADGTDGMGIWLHGGSKASGQRVSLEGNKTRGALVEEKSELTVSDVLVRGTQSQPSDLTRGRGFVIRSGATAQIERAFLDKNRQIGISVFDSGTSLTLSDAVMQNTQSQESDLTGGRGFDIEAGAQVILNRVFLDQSREAGLFLAGAGTVATLTDMVIQNTQSQESDKMFGEGLYIETGAQLTVNRVLLDRNRGAGLLVDGAGTVATLTDGVIQNTQSQEMDKVYGRGVNAQNGAQVSVERALFDHNRENGLGAFDQGTSLKIADVVIQNTQSREIDQAHGEGLEAGDGVQVAVSRAFLDDNRNVGVGAFGQGTSLQLSDVVIQNTQSQESDQTFGGALYAGEGAQVTVERAHLDHNRYAALALASPGTTLRLTDALVENTLVRENVQEYGVGVIAELGASLILERTVLRKNRVAAILLVQQSQATLTDCWLTDTIEGNFGQVDTSGQIASVPITGVSDGLVVLNGSSAQLTRTLVSGCSRAGLLFDSSTGTLASTVSSSNRFGLVLQGATAPAYDATDSFAGNSEQSIVTSGDLPVPNAPLDLPSSPSGP